MRQTWTSACRKKGGGSKTQGGGRRSMIDQLKRSINMKAMVGAIGAGTPPHLIKVGRSDRQTGEIW